MTVRDVDFDGGTITTDAGLFLLREVDRKLDLIRRIDQAIPDPRDQRYVTHKQREMPTSRIYDRTLRLRARASDVGLWYSQAPQIC